MCIIDEPSVCLYVVKTRDPKSMCQGLPLEWSAELNDTQLIMNTSVQVWRQEPSSLLFHE